MSETSKFGFANFLAQTDAVGLTVLVILVLMSVASWYLIALKSYRNAQIRARAREFLDRFWAAPSLEATAAEAADSDDEPFGRLAAQGIEASRHWSRSPAAAALSHAGGQDEFLTRAIRRAITRETAALESGLTVLASVGSTAPFVGLFGTVWGIYHALLGIGTAGNATLDTVAGPVGEALIMTALGLAVAIPAVLAYNAFVRGNRLLLAELDGFAHDLHAFLLTGAKLDSGGGVPTQPKAAAAARTAARPGAA
jgi:biopolymer transport protein ExbB